jgi:phospholipid transport system substrate-binding protein
VSAFFLPRLSSSVSLHRSLHRKTMKIFKLLFLLAAAAVAAFAFAADAPSQETPDVLVKRITQDVMETAKHDKEIKAGNRKRILQVVEEKILPHIDLERTVAMAVGRHWREATPQQQQQLTDEFRTMLIRTYAGALALVGDQKLVYKPLRAAPDDTEVVVRFEVQQLRGRDPVQVSYRLYKAQDGWKVYDVNVLGVWLVETYKSSFNAEIAKGGIEGLIRTLSDKNRELAARAAATTS